MKMTLLPTRMLAALIAVSVAAAAPSFGRSQGEVKTPAASKTLTCAGAEIEFEGVSFTCDPALAAEVRAAVLPASPLLSKADKPDYVAPERLSFTFDGPQTRRRVETYFGPPKIEVARLDAFARAHAIEPDYVSNFEKRAADIKTLLDARPKTFKDGVPFLPYVEGSQEFQTHVSYFNFRNGKAVAFVTHFSSEPSLITNQALTYVFEGITDDGRYYVSATFPLVASFLPADFSEAEAVKRGLDPTFRLADRDAERKYADYFKQTARELEQLAPDKFQPDLARLNKLLSTLNVRGRD